MPNAAPPPDAPSIAGRLFRLALPVIGLNVLQVLALAVDTAMCGRLDNADDALMALGYATQLTFLLMVAMMGLVVGTVALVARAHGAGEHERVSHVLRQSSQLTVLLATGVCLAGLLLGPSALRVLGASESNVELGMAYLTPILIGTPFYYLNILYAAVLRGVGNTLLPFLVALAANALNVFLNYGFILGNLGFPALGLQGAAIGTVASYALSTVAMVVLLRRGAIRNLVLRLKPAPVDRPLAKMLVGIGIPAALDMVVLNAAFLSIVGMLARVDEVAVAAHGVGLRIQALAFVPGLGISQATAAMVGNALGAENPDEAKAVTRASVALSTVIMSAIAASILFGVDGIITIFEIENASSLGELSTLWIQMLGWCMPIVGVYIAFVGMLRGAGETRTSLRINVWSTLAFQIPLSWLLGFPLGLGVFGIWIAFPISFVLKAVMAWWVYRSDNWIKLGVEAGPARARR